MFECLTNTHAHKHRPSTAVQVLMNPTVHVVLAEALAYFRKHRENFEE